MNDVPRRRVAKSLWFWFVFGAWQATGLVVPFYTNIHENIWPLFAGLMLVPGVAVPFVLNFLPLWLGMCLAVSVNAVVWYLLACAWDAAQPRGAASE